MAAITSRASCCKGVAQAALVFTLLLAVVVAGGRSPRANDFCGDIDVDTAVFPYWSRCGSPAVYSYYGEAYQVEEVVSGLLLAPEWDESNSTYYVRLAEEGTGATYELSHLSRELRPYVSLSQSLYFTNQETGRVLAWRNEGEEEFLVEVEADSGAALFEFASSTADVPLPCPRLYLAQCKTYNILAYNSTSGLAPAFSYVEDDATYFKKSATDLAAFVLLRSSSLSLRKNNIAYPRTSLSARTNGFS